jgi:LmbE family N-acetylglucosaminyl deacetylase
MLRTIALGLLLAMTFTSNFALAADVAPPRQPDAAQIARALDRLQVVGGVLYVAAHPDDENTLLLAWLANARLVRTGYLSVTRGDGGQNLIGSEQGPLLGLIRTQELLAARRLDGAEQLFTRARDFGYSKRADEALRIWGHDETLSDVVRAIRRFKPDVIITRFSPDDNDTHGHHTASAKLAVEAFAKAADPTYEPGQVHEYGVWQAKRIVWNASQFPGAPPRDFTGFVKLDVGGYSPMRGLSWGELAADSRSMHKSQGFGAMRRRGTSNEYFKVLAGAPISASPLDDVVLDWSRVHGAEQLAQVLGRVRRSFRPSAPQLSVPELLEARDLLDKLPDNPWKQPKRAEIDALVGACSGLFTELTGGASSVPQGGHLPLTVSAIARLPIPVTLESVLVGDRKIDVHKPLPENQLVEVPDALTIAPDAPLSTPYWLELPPEAGSYPVRDPAQIGLPEAPNALEGEFVFAISGHELRVRRAVSFKWSDPVAGERYRAVEVLPPVTVDFDRQVLLFPDSKPRSLAVRVRSTAGASGTVRVEGADGFEVTPSELPFRATAGGDLTLVFRVTPPSGQRTGTLHAVAAIDGDPRRYDRGLRRIEHEHIPVQTLLPRAEVRAVHVDVVRHLHRVGFIPGAGDETESALKQLGYEVVELDPRSLTAEALKGLPAIVTGVRAWNVEPRLVAAHALLMDWVAHGGTLVVQYNTNSRIGPAPPDLGPFPFNISHDRTTDETATVELSKDPVLASPNRIGPPDFEGWVQERGLYYADKWDSRYRTPLTMSDPGEKPLQGARLVAKHGKGIFVYTGLALFRQLPAGVPGAYRLFVNLVEHGGTGS